MVILFYFQKVVIVVVEFSIKARSLLASLFANTEETLVLSCLQGHMGRAFADRLEDPRCAQILVGDFCFFTGDAGLAGAKELVRNIPRDFSSPVILFIPLAPGWNILIEQTYSGRFEKTTRYAIKKEPDAFDRHYLEKLVSQLPEGFTMRSIDRELYWKSFEQEFSRDFCAQFDSAEDFLRRGLGVCALYQGTLVAGASSYTVYDSGIEIEVDTHPDFQRRGLACACAAKLILTCLEKGLYPSWDAANLASVSLAQKLGYHLDFAYPTYQIKC